MARPAKLAGKPGQPAAQPGNKIPNLDLRESAKQQEKLDKQEQPKPSAPPASRGTGGTPSTGGGKSAFKVMDVWSPTPVQNFVLGAGLIGLNFFTQTNMLTTLDRLWTTPKSAADAAKQPKFATSSLWQLGGELLFVLALSFITGFSPVIGRAVMLFLLALYAVWFTFNGQKFAGFRLFSSSSSNVPHGSGAGGGGGGGAKSQ